MARTRSTKGAGAGAKATSSPKTATTTTNNSSTVYTLPAESENPPRVFVLPKQTSPEARIVTLQNPRYSKPTRYLACASTGFYEFTKISASKTAPRSWLLHGSQGDDCDNKFDTHTTRGADLYVSSAIDPVFLVLPALVKSGSDKKRRFLSSDDHFDALSESSSTTDETTSHLSELLKWPEIRRILEKRMETVCDTVEAGGEQMFRLNQDKLLDEILLKAKRMAKHGLPKSMVEKFVTKALEAPILGIRSAQAASKPSNAATSQQESSHDNSGANTPSLESADSQSTMSSVETTYTSVSDASTAATSVSSLSSAAAEEPNNEVVNAMSASQEVIDLQTLRVAFDFICSTYLPPALSKALKENLLATNDSRKGTDFKPLDDYLVQLAKLRQLAVAARSTDYSRKRTMDEEADERAEKKRKKEEEDKIKNANMSRGVKQLKKVNTSGMKKLSEFFKKK